MGSAQKGKVSPSAGLGRSGRRGNLRERFPRRPNRTTAKPFAIRATGKPFAKGFPVERMARNGHPTPCQKHDEATFRRKGFPVAAAQKGCPVGRFARRGNLSGKVTPSCVVEVPKSGKGFHVCATYLCIHITVISLFSVARIFQN